MRCASRLLDEAGAVDAVHRREVVGLEAADLRADGEQVVIGNSGIHIPERALLRCGLALRVRARHDLEHKLRALRFLLRCHENHLLSQKNMPEGEGGEPLPKSLPPSRFADSPL